MVVLLLHVLLFGPVELGVEQLERFEYLVLDSAHIGLVSPLHRVHLERAVVGMLVTAATATASTAAAVVMLVMMPLLLLLLLLATSLGGEMEERTERPGAADSTLIVLMFAATDVVAACAFGGAIGASGGGEGGHGALVFALELTQLHLVERREHVECDALACTVELGYGDRGAHRVRQLGQLASDARVQSLHGQALAEVLVQLGVVMMLLRKWLDRWLGACCRCHRLDVCACAA